MVSFRLQTRSQWYAFELALILEQNNLKIFFSFLLFFDKLDLVRPILWFTKFEIW